MTKKNLLIILIGLVILVAALMIGINAFRTSRGGTPIIIKGGGDTGDVLSIQGPGKDDESVTGSVTAIKVIADEKCYYYDTPNLGAPAINLVTEPAKCNIDAAESFIFVAIELGFDRNTIKWTGSQFETNQCTISSLTVDPHDPPLGSILGKTDCTNPDSPGTCKPEFRNAKKLEITLYSKNPEKCP